MLARLSSRAELADLSHAVFSEECSEGEALDALEKSFIKVAAAGHQAALGQRELRELKKVEAIIEALRRKRDVTTLFRLACASRIPGRPTHLSERCIRAAVEAQDPQNLYREAVEAMNAPVPEPVATAVVTAAASAITALARSGFVPAFATAASLFEEGEGVPRDLAAAKNWYQVTATNCGGEAAEHLETVAWAYDRLLAVTERPPASFEQFWRHMASVAQNSARLMRALMPGDEIGVLIDGGEDELVEFKATLRWCTKDDRKHTGLEDEVVRAVASFLNAKGGSLFIGVTDDRKAYGIEKDWNSFSGEGNRNRDGFDRHLRGLLYRKLGSGPPDRITFKYHVLHDHQICRVLVLPSGEPVFVGKGQGRKLFVRWGTMKEEYKGPRLDEYIRRRWPDWTPPVGS